MRNCALTNALQVDNIQKSRFSKHVKMKKHMKCLENRDKSDLYHKTSFLPLRSSRLNNVEADKTTPIFGHKMQSPAKEVEQNREIKTIYIPKKMTDAPFLQYPGLTPGQKRFLYSIAEAYSKDHMRRLICQHYINVIHRCIGTDLNPHVKPQVATIYSPEVEHITESQSTIFGTKEHGRLSPAEKAKKTSFPKISQNKHRVPSRFPKTNTVQARRKTTTAKQASLRESQQWDVELKWEMTGVDSYVSRRISDLSFNESDDDNEDFLVPT